jgi:hypothetical protein
MPAAASEKSPLLGKDGKPNASAMEHGLANYDPHMLGTWQAFLTTRGTVFNDPVIWWTVLKLSGVALLAGFMLFITVPRPDKLDTTKFHDAVNFIKVFIAFMLGLFLNACLARWYSILQALTDLFLAVKKVTWTLNSCGVDVEDRLRIQKLMVLSCYLLEGEVSKQWESDKSMLKPHWESTCALCVKQNVMTSAQRQMLEKGVQFHNRSLAVWSWVGTLMRKLKGPGISPPMVSRIFQDAAEAIDAMKKIKTFSTLQLPFMYTHMLACLVQVNNILLAIACGLSCAVSVSALVHYSQLLYRQGGTQHLSEVYHAVQSLLVTLCCLVVEPMLYQAFLIIASTLADPFTHDKYGLPVLEYIHDLTTQLHEMNMFAEHKPDMTLPRTTVFKTQATRGDQNV